jgi:uncharacterized integral membrane protein (TIGR00698 family)
MNKWMGIALTAALAAAATELAQAGWLQANGISVLTLAIVLGMAAGNTVYPRIESGSAAGVAFSKNSLLRVGIVLYGLRLTLQDVAAVGAAGIAIDAVVLMSTFALACWAGTRVFGLDRTTAMLIGAGSSICGAAAVMAAEPVVRGRSDQVTVAVSTVVVFGTLAIFLYPALYHANQLFGPFAVSPTAYGIFAGSTIHEVAQVVAAGRAIGEAAADTAVITKMVRVMMLAPFLVILSMVLSRTGAATGAARRITIPWFALGFVAVTAFNSLKLLPRPFIEAAVQVDTLVLAMAMAALGLGTRWSAIRAAGAKPLALAALLFGWLMCGGSAINVAIQWALAG